MDNVIYAVFDEPNIQVIRDAVQAHGFSAVREDMIKKNWRPSVINALFKKIRGVKKCLSIA